MKTESNATEATQCDEFDIDLRLNVNDVDPAEPPQLITIICTNHTNGSTCSHTTPRLCC
jgi:hypothetical protein